MLSSLWILLQDWQERITLLSLRREGRSLAVGPRTAQSQEIFGAARNIENGGLTIIATALVDTGSRMTMWSMKSSGTGMRFILTEDLAKEDIPAIDLNRRNKKKNCCLTKRA